MPPHHQRAGKEETKRQQQARPDGKIGKPGQKPGKDRRGRDGKPQRDGDLDAGPGQPSGADKQQGQQTHGDRKLDHAVEGKRGDDRVEKPTQCAAHGHRDIEKRQVAGSGPGVIRQPVRQKAGDEERDDKGRELGKGAPREGAVVDQDRKGNGEDKPKPVDCQGAARREDKHEGKKIKRQGDDPDQGEGPDVRADRRGHAKHQG